MKYDNSITCHQIRIEFHMPFYANDMELWDPAEACANRSRSDITDVRPRSVWDRVSCEVPPWDSPGSPCPQGTDSSIGVANGDSGELTDPPAPAASPTERACSSCCCLLLNALLPSPLSALFLDFSSRCSFGASASPPPNTWNWFSVGTETTSSSLLFTFLDLLLIWVCHPHSAALPASSLLALRPQMPPNQLNPCPDPDHDPAPDADPALDPAPDVVPALGPAWPCWQMIALSCGMNCSRGRSTSGRGCTTRRRNSAERGQTPHTLSRGKPCLSLIWVKQRPHPWRWSLDPYERCDPPWISLSAFWPLHSWQKTWLFPCPHHLPSHTQWRQPP